jgi:uncharacterized protein (DUF4415 family)
MTEKKHVSKTDDWDPDTAPELTEAWFEQANVYNGDKLISRGRPKLETPKISTTLRLDADVIAQFKAKGPRWQTRINEALREWLKQAG